MSSKTSKKIIIPKGSIQPNETVVIEIPGYLRNNSAVLATRRSYAGATPTTRQLQEQSPSECSPRATSRSFTAPQQNRTARQSPYNDFQQRSGADYGRTEMNRTFEYPQATGAAPNNTYNVAKQMPGRYGIPFSNMSSETLPLHDSFLNGKLYQNPERLKTILSYLTEQNSSPYEKDWSEFKDSLRRFDRYLNEVPNYNGGDASHFFLSPYKISPNDSLFNHSCSVCTFDPPVTLSTQSLHENDSTAPNQGYNSQTKDEFALLDGIPSFRNILPQYKYNDVSSSSSNKLITADLNVSEKGSNCFRSLLNETPYSDFSYDVGPVGSNHLSDPETTDFFSLLSETPSVSRIPPQYTFKNAASDTSSVNNFMSLLNETPSRSSFPDDSRMETCDVVTFNPTCSSSNRYLKNDISKHSVGSNHLSNPATTAHFYSLLSETPTVSRVSPENTCENDASDTSSLNNFMSLLNKTPSRSSFPDDSRMETCDVVTFNPTCSSSNRYLKNHISKHSVGSNHLSNPATTDHFYSLLSETPTVSRIPPEYTCENAASGTSSSNNFMSLLNETPSSYRSHGASHMKTFAFNPTSSCSEDNFYSLLSATPAVSKLSTDLNTLTTKDPTINFLHGAFHNQPPYISSFGPEFILSTVNFEDSIDMQQYGVQANNNFYCRSAEPSNISGDFQYSFPLSGSTGLSDYTQRAILPINSLGRINAQEMGKLDSPLYKNSDSGYASSEFSYTNKQGFVPEAVNYSPCTILSHPINSSNRTASCNVSSLNLPVLALKNQTCEEVVYPSSIINCASNKGHYKSSAFQSPCNSDKDIVVLNIGAHNDLTVTSPTNVCSTALQTVKEQSCDSLPKHANNIRSYFNTSTGQNATYTYPTESPWIRRKQNPNIEFVPPYASTPIRPVFNETPPRRTNASLPAPRVASPVSFYGKEDETYGGHPSNFRPSKFPHHVSVGGNISSIRGNTMANIPPDISSYEEVSEEVYDSSEGEIDDSLMGKILRGEIGRVLVWPTPPEKREKNVTFNLNTCGRGNLTFSKCNDTYSIQNIPGMNVSTASYNVSNSNSANDDDCCCNGQAGSANVTYDLTGANAAAINRNVTCNEGNVTYNRQNQTYNAGVSPCNRINVTYNQAQPTAGKCQQAQNVTYGATPMNMTNQSYFSPQLAPQCQTYSTGNETTSSVPYDMTGESSEMYDSSEGDIDDSLLSKSRGNATGRRIEYATPPNMVLQSTQNINKTCPNQMCSNNNAVQNIRPPLNTKSSPTSSVKACSELTFKVKSFNTLDNNASAHPTSHTMERSLDNTGFSNFIPQANSSLISNEPKVRKLMKRTAATIADSDCCCSETDNPESSLLGNSPLQPQDLDAMEISERMQLESNLKKWQEARRELVLKTTNMVANGSPKL